MLDTSKELENKLDMSEEEQSPITLRVAAEMKSVNVIEDQKCSEETPAKQKVQSDVAKVI